MVSTEIEFLPLYDLLESAQIQLPVPRSAVQAKHELWKGKYCTFCHFFIRENIAFEAKVQTIALDLNDGSILQA